MPASGCCTYVLLAGLPGTGKSTLAAALAARLGAHEGARREQAVILNKDDVRTALFPGAAAAYSDAQNSLCMDAMLSAAGSLCSQASFIFFDGRTFSRADHIEQVTRAAEAHHAAWRILCLYCDDEIALARIRASGVAHPAKNRAPDLYLELKQRFEPILQPHLSLDTGRSMQICVEEAFSYLLC